MDVNKAVIDELDGLDFERQLLFAFGCVDRCLDLYRLFDAWIQQEDLKPLVAGKSGHASLAEMLEEGYGLILRDEVADAPTIDAYVARCHRLAPGDEEYGDFQANIAQYVACCLAYAFRFYQKGKKGSENISV